MDVYSVLYHIPGDHDDISEPNFFPLKMKNGEQPRLKDVRGRFPLPGVYHFRAKSKAEGCGPVWLDLQSDDTVVPSTQRKVITIKVLRLDWEPQRTTTTSSSKASNDPLADQGASEVPSNPYQRPAPAISQQPPPPPKDMIDLGGEGGSLL
eukprot:Trichotokara_eunicae@DN6011_c0_g1_i2.p2